MLRASVFMSQAPLPASVRTQGSLHLLAGISCKVQCLLQLLAHQVVMSTKQCCPAAAVGSMSFR